MVRLDDVVEILDLRHLDVRAEVGLNALDGSHVGAALVDGDLFGHTVQIDGPLQKTPNSSAVSLREAESRSCRRRSRQLGTGIATGPRP